VIELKIDPEFRDKIPPMTEEQFNGLREDILNDGYVRDPLVVWKEENILLDGHHRERIIRENYELLKDKYKIDYKSFPNRWAALEWICRNQLDKRNLNDEQITYIRGEMYKARKKSIGGDRGNQYTKMANHQNDDLPNGKKERPHTATRLAKEIGVGEATILRSEKFHDGVDAIREQSKEAANKIMSGGSGATKKEVQAFPTKAPEEQSKFISDVISGAKKAERATPKDEESRIADRERRALNKRLNAISEDMAKMKPRAYTKKDLLDELKVLRNEFVGKVRQTLKERKNVIGDGDEVYEVLVSCEKEIQKIEEEFIK